MAKEIQKNHNTLYQCEECGLLYENKEIADKCRAWCAEYKSCNLEIIKHALKE